MHRTLVVYCKGQGHLVCAIAFVNTLIFAHCCGSAVFHGVRGHVCAPALCIGKHETYVFYVPAYRYVPSRAHVMYISVPVSTRASLSRLFCLRLAVFGITTSLLPVESFWFVSKRTIERATKRIEYRFERRKREGEMDKKKRNKLRNTEN